MDNNIFARLDNIRLSLKDKHFVERMKNLKKPLTVKQTSRLYALLLIGNY